MHASYYVANDRVYALQFALSSCGDHPVGNVVIYADILGSTEHAIVMIDDE